METKKRKYEAPKVQKVRLVIKNAVLGTCHESPNLTPRQGELTCAVPQSCYDGPGF